MQCSSHKAAQGPAPSTNGSSMPQHSAACCSCGARFPELLVGVLKHAAACRSEPKFSHGGLKVLGTTSA